MGGNLYGVKPEVGRYDASYGIYLENLGDHQFKYHRDGRGLFLDGEIRDIKVSGRHLIVTKNNDSTDVYKF
jgi:pSer/pThr/pTyr-binding forkhead associated (FHA) protein